MIPPVQSQIFAANVNPSLDDIFNFYEKQYLLSIYRSNYGKSSTKIKFQIFT